MAELRSPRPVTSRPRTRWPLILFILVAVGAVFGTALLANDRKNLKRLVEFLQIPMPATSVTVAPSLEPIPSVAETPPAPEVHWPWLASTDVTSIWPAPSSSAICAAQSLEQQEKPAYAASPERGWECSMLRTNIGETHVASLFLQARGREHSPADGIRVKFNLSGGSLSPELADQALAFIHATAAMRPDVELDEALRKRLTGQADFYFIAGYQGMSFRREIADPSRYNLIGRDVAMVDGRPQILDMEPSGAVDDEDSHSGKGPRLLTLPTGND